MSGQGIRVFNSGEVLTADQVNGYLMDQVIARFADAATRDASFGGVGQPQLSEGRFCYLDDIDEVQYYNGSSWQSAPQFVLGDGTVTTAKLADSAVTSAKIADGSITNSKIASNAAISLSKLATGTAGQVIIHNASGVPTATTVTGDVTISSTGVTAIGAGVIVNADISTTAAIEASKVSNPTLNAKTSNYQLALPDRSQIIEMNVGSANTVTVPTNTTAAFPIGTQITIIQNGTGKTQIVAAVGVTILSTPGLFLRTRYSSATLIKRATNEWYAFGDLSAS